MLRPVLIDSEHDGWKFALLSSGDDIENQCFLTPNEHLLAFIRTLDGEAIDLEEDDEGDYRSGYYYELPYPLVLHIYRNYGHLLYVSRLLKKLEDSGYDLTRQSVSRTSL